MTSESIGTGPGVARAATGSGVVVFLGTVAGSLLQGSISNLDVGLVTSALIAAGLGAVLYIYQRALSRDARARRASAVREAAQTHHISLDPRSIAFLALLGLLIFEFAYGFVIGLALGLAGASSGVLESVFGILSLVFLPLASGTAAWYMSPRIGVNGMVWIAGTVLTARALSGLIGLFVFGFAAIGVVASGVLLLTAVSVAGAWLGHLISKRRQQAFTVAYLARLLDHEDRIALIDLIAMTAGETFGEVGEETSTVAESGGAPNTRFCTTCGNGLDSQARFCGRCGAEVGAAPTT